ncbi:MAG: 50S ribosomal protein L21 [Bacteroidetes bacterium]|nr:50S ribosomal protein L21 [Bacteroidota bacterium]
MYAIVDVAGQQFKVTKDQKIFVHRLDGEEGDKVEFNKVLLIDNDDKVEVGEPVIKGALIRGKILEHLKGDTVKVFKKKRRKGYKVLKGHREYLSHIIIDEIIEKGATKSVAEKETTKPAQTQKTAPKAVKAAPKAEKATPKAVSAKKPVAISSEAKAKTTATKSVKSTPATKKPAAKKAKPITEAKTSTKKTAKKTTSPKKTKE